MTSTELKTRLYQRLEHLNDTEIRELYKLVAEIFPQNFNKTSPTKKRQLGALKGQFKLADDWDSDEVNEKIARAFHESSILPDANAS